MKRGLLICTVLAAVVLTAPVAFGGDEECWFDLEDCSMCKHMLAEEGLMDHMKWETHVITNGMLSVTHVDPAYKEAFERAMANMEKTGKKLQTGEQMYLCGHCKSYGTLIMAGAKFELVESSVGSIDLMTSADPAVVGMIQTHAQRTIDEYNAMLAEKP